MNRLSNTFKQQILLLICCFCFFSAFSQPATISADAKISVLTCGIGNEMYTLFGHTALRIVDDEQNLDVVYNWGMFDFNTPNFYSHFVKGDLLYYLDVDSFNDFIYHYKINNREVVEQELNLDYNEKLNLWTEINRQLKSNDRFYTYGFIDNNCTTKVVDVINKVRKSPLSTDFPSNNFTYRKILNESLENHYFHKLGINLLFGYPTNKKAELIFLPVKLKDGLEYDKSIVKKEIFLNRVEANSKSFSLNSIYSLWAIVVVLAITALKHNSQKIYFFTTTLFSVFLLAVSLYTHHEELHYNVLILFYNPLVFLGVIIKNRFLIILGSLITFLSLFFFGIELIMITLPLIVLNMVFISALLLWKR